MIILMIVNKERESIVDLVLGETLINGVQQGSILGPLLFNIYINDFFLFSSTFNIATYADGCSPYEFSGSINDVISKLENDSVTLITWYESNYLQPNPDKWHLLLNVAREDLTVSVGNKCVPNTSCEHLLLSYVKKSGTKVSCIS